MVARPGEGPGGRPSPVDPVDPAARRSPPDPEAAGRWAVRRLHGSATDLHHRLLPADLGPTVWFLTVEHPALVLGSTQPAPPGPLPEGLEVVRRRSGGGAVLVEPDNPLWVDVFVPAGDRRWCADVGRAFLWLGEAWAGALAAAGAGPASVHRGAPARTPVARAVCFAGLSPGEVTVGGRKVVGISQRRTRAGALFQSAVLLRWDPDRIAALAGVPPRQLAGVATGAGRDRVALEESLLGWLTQR